MPPSIDRPSGAADSLSQPHGRRFLLVTFGKPSVYVADANGEWRVLGAVQLKHLAVLTYLAMSEGRTAWRRVISDYLWGQNEDKDPRHGLRSSINLLRSDRGLGAEALSSGDKESVTLLADVAVDCLQFQRLINEGRHAEALDLYQGKFFAEWGVLGAEDFEDWASGKRAEFSRLFCATASAFARDLIDKGRPQDAAKLAERVRDEMPEARAHWKLLLECRVAARDRVRALSDAEHLEQLERDGELELDDELRRLIRTARSATPEFVAAVQPRSHGALTPEMVGREREFSLLVQAWERARADKFVHVRIESGPGFGKTRLLEEFGARLRGLPTRPPALIYVRANIAHRGSEFDLAARLASALGRFDAAHGVDAVNASVLAAMDPVLASVYGNAKPFYPPPTDAVRIRAAALADLAAAVGEKRPLVLLVDDIHWADLSSRHTIASAFANVAKVPLLLVTSARTSLGIGLSADSDVRLAPLQPEAIRQLCDSIADLPEAPWVDTLIDGLHRNSQGSPLQVLQSLALVMDSGGLRVNDGAWECTDRAALQASVEGAEVIARRLEALTPPELFMLIVAGIAGGSLSADALTAAIRRSGKDVDTALARLEERGLVERVGDTLRPAHDELVEHALGHVDTDVVRKAHALVAEQLDAVTADAPEALREIGSHYRAAREAGRTAAVFVRFVRARRAGGDRRPAMAVAREFAGDAPVVEHRALVRALPLTLRHAHVWHFGIGAVAVAAVLFAAIIVQRITREQPANSYAWIVLEGERQALAAESVGIRPDLFGNGRIGEVGRHPQIHIDGLPWDFGSITLNPQRSRVWATSGSVSDSGVTELFLIENGRARRLTYSRGDDVGPSWSPDGKRIVFATSRWSKLGRTNLAVIDLSSDSVTRLTDIENGWDVSPAWSPDGTRIGFVRRYASSGGDDYCIVAVDRASTTCASLGEHITPESEQSWTDDATFGGDALGYQNAPLTAAFSAKSGIKVVAATRDRINWLGQGSPSFRMFFPGTDHHTFDIALRADPAQRNAYRVVGGWTSVRAALIGGRSKSHPFLDSIWVALPGRPVTGVGFQLSAAGRNSAGEPATPTALHWTLLGDSSRAHVSPSGVFVATSPGSYRVRVTAGGWRTADATIEVAQARDSTLVIEDWSGDPWQRWRRFGSPLPVTVREGETSTLNVNNGGTFYSGVYAPNPFDASEGLGIDALISTPITMGQWQEIIIGVTPATDSLPLASWDHRSGWPRISSGDCWLHYPSGSEGDHKADVYAVDDSLGNHPAPRSLGAGTWYRLRLQVLPDGRCVTALNGTVVAVSKPSTEATLPRRIYIYGATAKTKIRVGHLEIFRGVRRDISLDTLQR